MPFSSTWGPPGSPPKSLGFNDAPYAPFSKGDKLGKVADWGQDPLKEKETKRIQHARGFRDPYHAYGSSSSFFFTTDTPETAVNFSVVDKQAPKQVKGGGGGGAASAVLKRRSGVGSSGAGAPSNQYPGSRNATSRNIQEQQQQQQQQQNSTFKPRQRPSWQVEKRIREPSVQIGTDWQLVQTNQFSELQKLHLPQPEPTVLYRAGRVCQFDKQSETTKEPRKLAENGDAVYAVTARDDPVIEKIAAERPRDGATYAYASDKIITLLMCASRTNIPWDVIITKKQNGDIFFDKRENGPLDFLTVNENSSNPPQDTAEIKMNTPRALALEATYLNTKFCAAVLTEPSTSFEHPNPFADEVEAVLPKGYLYTRTDCSSNDESDSCKPTFLVLRSEVDAVNEDGSFDIVRALNEYQPLEWKDGWANHRGAIIASEMRNNLSKLCQWTAQAYLAGAKHLKLGFVSRVNVKDRTQHELIGVQNRDPATFSKELNFNIDNGWGIVASLINIFQSRDAGRYVLMRDPNAPALKIYRVPDNAVIE